MGPVRAIVCDLDGVVRTHPDPHALEAATGLPAGALHATAFHPELLHPALDGRATDEQWREAVQEALLERFPGCDAPRAVAGWWTPGSADPQVVGLLQQARDRVPVLLLTNATTRLAADLASLGLSRCFDAVVNTCEVGVAKPDHGAFLAAADMAAAVVPGPAPGGPELLMVDDRAANVDAARALGWRAHHYSSARRLREDLEHLGVVDARGRR